MKLFRKLIYQVFGLEFYLSLISIIYIRIIRIGLLKKKYPELFFLKRLVKENYTCIDIGANLGYYSTFLSNLVGKESKVYAIEPVPLFRKVLKKNIRKTDSKNIEVLPFALGEKNETIKMGMPQRDGVIHHGMTKVADSANDDYVEYFEAEMRIPNELFQDIPKIDFIKCDVEGYEQYVFSNMKEILKKHKPLVQSELGGKENRENVYHLFMELEYDCFQLNNWELIQISEKDLFKKGTDFYFLPKK